MKEKVEFYFDNLFRRYRLLKGSAPQIEEAFRILVETFNLGGKLLICGNGGSAADAEHITGELMKGFMKQRPLPFDFKEKLVEIDMEKGKFIAERLQQALPTIPLTNQSAVNTAYANDVDPYLIFAQQVYAMGKQGDTLLAISTSGNSKNVIYAVLVAKAIGLTTIGLTGSKGGRLKEICDVTIRVPGDSAYEIQEGHLPVYHTLCLMLEEHFFAI